jgi:hypothetical protein
MGQTINNNIKFSKPLAFKIGNKKPIEFKLNENVNFNLNTRNFFKLNYKHEGDKPKNIYFSMSQGMSFYIDLAMNGKTEGLLYNYSEYVLFNFTVSKSEEIYLEFYSPDSAYYEINNTFVAFIDGAVIDTIDLNNKMYNGSSKIKVLKKIQPNKYIVTKLKEDKIVYFTFEIENIYSDFTYPNPFEICDNFNMQIKYNIL